MCSAFVALEKLQMVLPYMEVRDGGRIVLIFPHRAFFQV